MPCEPESQELMDTFYWKHGPCCAGCDWWRDVRAGFVGECTKSAPMSGVQRAALLGITWTSFHVGAGHALTYRDYHCGDFKDDFDWSSLSLFYRKRVGAPIDKDRRHD